MDASALLYCTYGLFFIFRAHRRVHRRVHHLVEDWDEKKLGSKRIMLFGFDVEYSARFVDYLIDPIDQVGVRQ